MGFTLLTADYDAQPAGTDSVLSMGAVPSQESQGSWLVAKMSLVSPALVTGATATQLVFTFNQYRAGVLVAALGSFTTSTGNNLAAHVETNVPVTGAPVLLPGDVIEVAVTHASTGTAIPQGLKAKVEIQ